MIDFIIKYVFINEYNIDNDKKINNFIIKYLCIEE